ncbi:MAG: hypothetical protein R6U70_01525 [Bacillota bacterium]
MDREHRGPEKLPPHRLKELVSASVRGDMDAFETLFGSAERALYRMGLSITGNPRDADEAWPMRHFLCSRRCRVCGNPHTSTPGRLAS